MPDDVSAQPLTHYPADSPRSVKGLRAVALFEAGKGLLVLFVGLGLLSLVHKNVQALAEEVVHHFHLNPAHHYPRILIDACTHINDSRLRWFALGAVAYSVIRFVEAYGLWLVRSWAEWFAIVSGGLYLPVEIYELVRHPSLVKAVVLIVNAAIVAYLIFVRWDLRRSSRKG